MRQRAAAFDDLRPLPIVWEPTVFRIRERFSRWLVDAKGVLGMYIWEADDQSKQIHELAPIILDYVRMRFKEYPEQEGVVEVAELVLRFREEAGVIRKTLQLLEKQGYAIPIVFQDAWEILNPSREVGQIPIPGQEPGNRQKP